MLDEVRKYLVNHCASGGVVVVQFRDFDGTVAMVGVFNDFDLAEKWVEKTEMETGNLESCFITPNFINDPECDKALVN